MPDYHGQKECIASNRNVVYVFESMNAEGDHMDVTLNSTEEMNAEYSFLWVKISRNRLAERNINSQKVVHITVCDASVSSTV